MTAPVPIRDGQRGRRKVALVAVVVIAVIVLAVGTAMFRPWSRGQQLEKWLRFKPYLVERDYPGGWSVFDRDAVAAIHAAGVDGIRVLLDEIEAKENGWLWQAVKLEEWFFSKNRALDTGARWFVEPMERGTTAARLFAQVDPIPTAALSLLGERWQKAERRLSMTNRGWLMPTNIDLADHRELYVMTLASAIQRTGPAGLPLLTNALRGDSRAVSAALGALGRYGKAGNPAVPAIVAVTDDSAFVWEPVPTFIPFDREAERSSLVLAREAISALITIHGDVGLTAPVLLRAATNGNPAAVAALGEYGPAIRDHLPALLTLTNHPDDALRFQLDIAARRIRAP